MGWLRDAWFKLKIFLWYLITEPFRQLQDFFYYLTAMLDKTTSWIYIFIVIVMVALMVGQRWIASMFLLVLLLIILAWEWQSGFFMHRYREKERRRINEKIKGRGEEDGRLDADR
jgi:hypothetical protein